MRGLKSSYLIFLVASFLIRRHLAVENITFLFPDDACTLSPPVFVDEQLRYHFGFYGSDMDSLCNTIEFHGKDTKEIYANEFTMCFKNVWYRDPYCALSIKVLEGNKDGLSKYEFNCTRKPNRHQICLEKNQVLFVRLDVGWGYELSEMSFLVEAPKQYKRFWEYSIVQAVSGIVGGTVVLCVLIGLFLCRQNKVNKKNRNRRPVPMHYTQSKDRQNLRRSEIMSKGPEKVSLDSQPNEKSGEPGNGNSKSRGFSQDANIIKVAGTGPIEKQTGVVNRQQENAVNKDLLPDDKTDDDVKSELDPKNIKRAHAWMTSATKRTLNKL